MKDLMNSHASTNSLDQLYCTTTNPENDHCRPMYASGTSFQKQLQQKSASPAFPHAAAAPGGPVAASVGNGLGYEGSGRLWGWGRGLRLCRISVFRVCLLLLRIDDMRPVFCGLGNSVEDLDSHCSGFGCFGEARFSGCRGTQDHNMQISTICLGADYTPLSRMLIVTTLLCLV